MPGIHDLPLFIVSGLLLNLMPGPDTLFIVTRSAAQGWRAGSVAALAICSGVLAHILAAALGLSALLATSAAAFMVIKLAGAVYLLYIGIMLIVSVEPSAGKAAQPGVLPTLPYRTIYWQGFLTNVLNPKVALFFVAFVPQFIDADAPNKALAFVVLGGIFDLGSLLWCLLLAMASGVAGQRFRASRRLAGWLSRGVGALFVSFGIKLALLESR